MPTNTDVAKKLLDIRMLMELAGEPFYKYTAFERAAATIENASPIADVIAAGELLKLPGIGKSIGGAIQEIVSTGTAQILEDLHKRYPPTIFEVLGVSGIGVKTAALLFEDYGIASLADLEKAIAGDALAGVPRLGPKTIENWKRGILAYKGRARRTPMPEALAFAQEAISYLLLGPSLAQLGYAGSLRRQEITVGDIDLVCTSDNAEQVTQYFARWERAETVLAEGPTKCSVWLPGGLQIDLRVLPDRVYGNLLQHFTGSREHNIKLREHAVRRNLRVSENGILNLETGDVVTCTDENTVYEALGMQYIPPELRSGMDEIELALSRAIPKLIEPSEIRGDFHMHSTWSDGDDSLDDMIAAAATRGYAYHAMSDHSWGRGRLGLDPDRLREQRAYIRSLGDKYGIRTLHGSEVDIKPDGTMDYPDEVLAELDIVIGSVHSSFSMDRDQMTKRLIRACENPYVNVIGHPTGRRVEPGSDGHHVFPGYEFDYDAVFAVAARTGTAFEIDGQAVRLDLGAPLARRAKEAGVILTCDSDAHAIADLDDILFAIGQARRAGLEPHNVLNTWPIEKVLEFVAKKRAQ